MENTNLIGLAEVSIEAIVDLIAEQFIEYDLRKHGELYNKGLIVVDGNFAELTIESGDFYDSSGRIHDYIYDSRIVKQNN